MVKVDLEPGLSPFLFLLLPSTLKVAVNSVVFGIHLHLQRDLRSLPPVVCSMVEVVRLDFDFQK